MTPILITRSVGGATSARDPSATPSLLSSCPSAFYLIYGCPSQTSRSNKNISTVDNNAFGNNRPFCGRNDTLLWLKQCVRFLGNNRPLWTKWYIVVTINNLTSLATCVTMVRAYIIVSKSVKTIMWVVFNGWFRQSIYKIAVFYSQSDR